MGTEHRMALFEAGISMPGEMEKLEAVIRPSFGIFTGIGAAHDENFTSRRQKTEEKLKLFANARTLICSSDDEHVLSIIRIYAAKYNITLFTVGRSHDSLVRVMDITPEGDATLVSGLYNKVPFRLQVPFTDEASVKNSLLCFAAMLFLDFPAEKAADGISRLETVAMRMEQSEGINNSIMINDSYNNDVTALTVALDHLKQNNVRPGRFLVLSDILQTGIGKDMLLMELAELLNAYRLTGFVGIGTTLEGLKGRLSCKTWFYEDTDHFLRYHPMSAFRNSVILLKGARPFRFERIRDALQRQSHGTVLEINLNALVHNLNYFRSKLHRDTRVMAMIKASSYGSGSFEIASVLQHHQVEYLAVAYCDEGIELRNAGITLPVMVMNPEPATFDLMITHRLEPAIYSFPLLHGFHKALERSHPNPYPIHIEVDTGMHRLGFNPEEIPDLIQYLSRQQLLSIRTVFSHLATADNRTDTTFAKAQIDLFSSIRDQFTDAFDPAPWFHILNSAGILNHPDAQFDMVRPGIGLYGIADDPGVARSLRNTVTLKSVVSQVRKIKKGDSVGYNRSFIAEKDSLIATIAIGYADGFSRHLGQGVGSVLIRNHEARVIGDVCMDMIMADVTAIPDVDTGDEVIIFNDRFPVTTIASRLGTIPYEVLTSLSSRIKRVYLSE
jgi:Alr-MurF fusion protein